MAHYTQRCSLISNTIVIEYFKALYKTTITSIINIINQYNRMIGQQFLLFHSKIKLSNTFLTENSMVINAILVACDIIKFSKKMLGFFYQSIIIPCLCTFRDNIIFFGHQIVEQPPYLSFDSKNSPQHLRKRKIF